jgi:hypothetical protein
MLSDFIGVAGIYVFLAHPQPTPTSSTDASFSHLDLPYSRHSNSLGLLPRVTITEERISSSAVTMSQHLQLLGISLSISF